MLSEVAIRTRALSKSYPIFDRPHDRLKQMFVRGRRKYYRDFWAVRDIDLEVRRGETVGIVGRNGAGKSTLLRLISGTLTPTSGTVEVSGRTAALLELGSGFNPDFTGRENVYMNGAILGLRKEEIDARFEDIAAFAEIGEFIEQPVKTYSSGMMVRLAFAVSVHVDANVLIVDEALSVGDVAFQYRCLDRLDKLTRSGATLLFVSHDISAVTAFCQRAVYMEAGCIKMVGTPDVVTEAYLADARRADRVRHGSLAPVPPIGSAKQSIGSRDAKIVGAVFDQGGSHRTADIGETILFKVAVDVTTAIQSPALVVILADRRLVAISGKRLRLTRSGGCVRERISVEVSVPMRLSPGHYFIALKLEDVQTEHLFRVVEWQSAALQVEVLGRNSERHYGVVDLGLRIEQRESEAVDEAIDTLGANNEL